MFNNFGYHNSAMDMNSFDPRISNSIQRWMEGTVGDGVVVGAISRSNDALFNV
jgi:hypothetical protein